MRNAQSHRLEFFAARLRGLTHRVFDEPIELAEAAAQWMEDEATREGLKEIITYAYQGEVTEHELEKARPLLWENFATFVGMSRSGLMKYRQREGFADVMEMVEQMIFAQQYEAGAAGLMNTNLVARYLKLAEKNELSGADGAPLQAVVQYQLPSNGRDDPPPAEGT